MGIGPACSHPDRLQKKEHFKTSCRRLPLLLIIWLICILVIILQQHYHNPVELELLLGHIKRGREWLTALDRSLE